MPLQKHLEELFQAGGVGGGLFIILPSPDRALMLFRAFTDRGPRRPHALSSHPSHPPL